MPNPRPAGSYEFASANVFNILAEKYFNLFWERKHHYVPRFETSPKKLLFRKRLLERGKSSGRVDDQDESKIKNRFEEYNKKTAPLINYYKRQNKFHTINGIGSIKEITERLTKLIDQL